MEEKKQVGRFTDTEIEIVKNTFKDNDQLIKSIRKSMLQLPLNAVDLSALQLNLKGQVPDVIRKQFTPVIDGTEPLGAITDNWFAIDIKGRLFEDAIPVIKAHIKLIDYVNQQLDELTTGKEKRDILLKDLTAFDKKADMDIYIDLIARNTIILVIEQKLMALNQMANQIDETPQQREEREKRNSSK